MLPVASALLVTVSFPPFNVNIAAWFSLAPLLFALRQRGTLSAGGLAFLFGCLFGLGAFYWANNIEPVNLANFLIMLIFFSLYFLIFGLLYRLISMGIGSWNILGAPALWVAIEYVRSNLSFLACPWNLVGQSQYGCLPVIQIADFTGVYGISFLIVMVNQLLSQVPDLFAARGGGRIQ
ncbi:Apolipoprotein N-acyltransferase [subsurface metagenome]